MSTNSPRVIDYPALAQQLNAAWDSREKTQPLTVSAGVATIDDAYAVQSAWSTLREREGDRVVGRKIGLTSKAMQEQAGFDQPDFGRLWVSRYFEATDNRVEIPADLFLQPRLEGEIAFRLRRPLSGPDVTAEQVLDATDVVAVAFEIVDSRFVRENFKVLDTIADNASYGGFTLGPWSRTMLEGDLRDVRMTMAQNGNVVVTGTGADSLGHPANAVAWLANKLAEYEVTLQPGETILSGSLGRAIFVNQGDEFVLTMTGEEPLTARFT
jgi:2-keto-4-pentenoate hydratase